MKNLSFPIWNDTRWRSMVTVNCWTDRVGGDLYGYPHEADSYDYCAWLCWAQAKLNVTKPGSLVNSDLALRVSTSNGTVNGSNSDATEIAGWCDGFAYNEKQHRCWLKFRTDNISATYSNEVAVGLLRTWSNIVSDDRQHVSTSFKARRISQGPLHPAGRRAAGAENTLLRVRKDRAAMAPFPIARTERMELVTDENTGKQRNTFVSFVYTFSFESGVDRAGSDMDESVNMTASSWEDCSYRCAEVRDCGGFVWRNDTDDRPCQLKKKTGDGTTTALKEDPYAMWSVAQVLSLSFCKNMTSDNIIPPLDESSPIYESNLAYPFDDVGTSDVIDCRQKNSTSFFIRLEDDGFHGMDGVEARASVECGKDRWGGEVADSPIEAPSYGYCAWVCYGKYRMNNKECLGFTYWPEKRQCYLENPLPDQAAYTDDPSEARPIVISGALAWRYHRGQIAKSPKKQSSPKTASTSSSTSSSSTSESSSTRMAISTVFRTVIRESISVVTVSRGSISTISVSPGFTPPQLALTTESPTANIPITPSKPCKTTKASDPNDDEDRRRPNHWKSES